MLELIRGLLGALIRTLKLWWVEWAPLCEALVLLTPPNDCNDEVLPPNDPLTWHRAKLGQTHHQNVTFHYVIHIILHISDHLGY